MQSAGLCKSVWTSCYSGISAISPILCQNEPCWFDPAITRFNFVDNDKCQAMSSDTPIQSLIKKSNNTEMACLIHEIRVNIMLNTGQQNTWKIVDSESYFWVNWMGMRSEFER